MPSNELITTFIQFSVWVLKTIKYIKKEARTYHGVYAEEKTLQISSGIVSRRVKCRHLPECRSLRQVAAAGRWQFLWNFFQVKSRHNFCTFSELIFKRKEIYIKFGLLTETGNVDHASQISFQSFDLLCMYDQELNFPTTHTARSEIQQPFVTTAIFFFSYPCAIISFLARIWHVWK